MIVGENESGIGIKLWGKFVERHSGLRSVITMAIVAVQNCNTDNATLINFL